MRLALAQCWSERYAPCALRSTSVDALEGAGEREGGLGAGEGKLLGLSRIGVNSLWGYRGTREFCYTPERSGPGGGRKGGARGARRVWRTVNYRAINCKARAGSTSFRRSTCCSKDNVIWHSLALPHISQTTQRPPHHRRLDRPTRRPIDPFCDVDKQFPHVRRRDNLAVAAAEGSPPLKLDQ